MSEGLGRFNALPREEAERDLYACFANHDWAARLAAGRPYPSVDALLAGAEAAWARLGPGDWLRAFAAHPRIGERGGHSPAASEREQAGVTRASAAALATLAAENRVYEERFGHVFLIAARGRGADEILHALRTRMKNDPYTELEVAAGEQRKITRMRLLALVGQ